jgi:hypothetical protein
MILPLLLAAAAAPQPAELKTFHDWTVGCDNGRACHAVALVPEDWPDDTLTMSVRRGAEVGAQPVVAFDIGAGSTPGSLRADGKRLSVRLLGAEEVTRVAAADTQEMIGVLRSAAWVEVWTADGTRLGKVSLKGASAALLYMDEQQRRTGTPTALVRRGSRAPDDVSPPPLPVVAARPISSARAPAMSAAALRALRRKHGCTLDEVGGPEEAETAALDAGVTLLLLACGSGAYNVSSVPFVVRRGSAGLADFDFKPAWWEKGKPMLTNAAWDAERGLLISFGKARGLGDCGTTNAYAWDGRAFRLVEQADMDECRGSRDFITTWRATVVRR